MLARTVRLDVAVAYVGTGPALDEVLEFARRPRKRIRVIASLDMGVSDPAALRDLCSVGELRTLRRPRGLFHPKVFIFYSSKASESWIGSANMTRGGFSRNEELVARLSTEPEVVLWFDKLWEKASPLDLAAIDDYELQRPPPTGIAAFEHDSFPMEIPKPEDSAHSESPPLFVLKVISREKIDIRARAQIRNGDFVVLRGSTGLVKPKKENLHKRVRDEFLNDGTIAPKRGDPNRTEFLRDAPFKSSSAASSAVLNGQSTGPQKWRIENSTLTLKDWVREQHRRPNWDTPRCLREIVADILKQRPVRQPRTSGGD